MNRRQVIKRSATMVGTSVALAGCTTGGESEDAKGTDSVAEADQTEDEPEEDKPEPEGGDGKPYTHYNLDIIDKQSKTKPVWIDHNERVYGRDGKDLLVSDDWWDSTAVLHTFDRTVETVIVPESGEIIVAVGGRDKEGGEVKRLKPEHGKAKTLYQFDYGRVSNSMGHVVHEDIVVLSCYEGSHYDKGLHANEVILSTDGGKSFKQILEVDANTTDAANNHIHDVEYDPYAERIWVAVGDHGNSQIYWSDDLGDSWKEIAKRGDVTMITQIAAFKDCVAFGTDGAPEGIIRWERDGPDDEPESDTELVRPHVQIETDPDDDTMEMYARRRWHIREDLEEGRELCLMPFGYSPMHDSAEDSVVLASTDGDEWYELHRTETRDILLTNVIGPLSMDGDRRTIVSDSNQKKGYQIEATVPEFWN